MLCKKIIAVYSENHTKQINTLFGQNAVLLIVIAGGTYTCHWGFKRLKELQFC
jgi:hypothetical protein